MDSYRSALEVLKWTDPKDTLQYFSSVSSLWSRACASEEIWITFGDSFGLVVSSDCLRLSHRDRFRLCRQAKTIALLSPTKLRVFDILSSSWETFALSTRIEVDKSSVWALIPRENAYFVCGGGAGFDIGDTKQDFRSAFRVSQAGEVRRLPDMKTGRNWHGVIVYADTSYVFGGAENINEQLKSTTACEKLSLVRGAQWRDLPPMLTARHIFCPCRHERQVYLLGGQTPACEVFSLSSEQFRALSLTLNDYFVHTLALRLSSEIVVIGDTRAVFWNPETNSRSDLSRDSSFTWSNSTPVVRDGAMWIAHSHYRFSVSKIDLQTLRHTIWMPEDAEEFSGLLEA